MSSFLTTLFCALCSLPYIQRIRKMYWKKTLIWFNKVLHKWSWKCPLPISWYVYKSFCISKSYFQSMGSSYIEQKKLLLLWLSVNLIEYEFLEFRSIISWVASHRKILCVLFGKKRAFLYFVLSTFMSSKLTFSLPFKSRCRLQRDQILLSTDGAWRRRVRHLHNDFLDWKTRTVYLESSWQLHLHPGRGRKLRLNGCKFWEFHRIFSTIDSFLFSSRYIFSHVRSRSNIIILAFPPFAEGKVNFSKLRALDI